MSESEFSVHTGSRARSLRGNLLLRPVELGSVDPHAVQNDRELARDGDCGFRSPFRLATPLRCPGFAPRGIVYYSLLL